MAMATQNFRHDVLPPSPTLTNPDLILPDSHVGSYSPPESSSSSAYAQQLSSTSSSSFKLADAPPGRLTSSSRTATPTSTATSSYKLSEDSSPARQKYTRSVDLMVAANSLRSTSSHSTLNAFHSSTELARSNSSSGSIRTQEMDSMDTAYAAPNEFFHRGQSNKGPKGDGSARDVDEDNTADEEGQEAGDVLAALPRPKGLDDEVENEEQDDAEFDLTSHTALSKRAEMILANAKKRLNVMEGNLRGARSSLLVPSQALSNLKTQTELSAQIHAARERDRRLYGGIGSIPPRPHDNSPLTNLSPGHSRGLSETFTPSSLPAGAVKKIHMSQKRASSALGPIRGQWSPSEGAAPFTRTPSIRSSRSQEQIRQERLHTWQGAVDSHGMRRLSPDARASPTSNLDTLPEDDGIMGEETQRSSSTTSDLRTQMMELKGRISSLKERAKEDGMKRRSMQSLRTPSPFTAAESWYSGTEAYQNGSPVTADAGLGIRAGNAHIVGREEAELSQNGSSNDHGRASVEDYGDQHSKDLIETREMDEDHEGTIDDYGEDDPANGMYAYSDGTTGSHETPIAQPSHLGYDLEQEPGHNLDQDVSREVSSAVDTESVYEDAEWEPVSERHEDRADAFDYENFFLHSAMGTYLADRRSSVSSSGSVETTRPASPPRSASAAVRSRSSQDSRATHRRTRSNDSISTVQTFATATEGRSSRTPGLENEDENEELDVVTSHLLRQSSYQALIPPTPPLPQHMSSLVPPIPGNDRADSAFHLSDNGASRTTSKSVADMLVSILTSRSRSDQGPSPLEDQDIDLLYMVAESLDAVSKELQSTQLNSYERRVWRRRLDDARRMLDGEGEGESS